MNQTLCKRCSRSFDSEKAKKKHRNNECVDKLTISRELLSNHVAPFFSTSSNPTITFNRNNDGFFSCPQCLSNFKNAESFRKHLKTVKESEAGNAVLTARNLNSNDDQLIQTDHLSKIHLAFNGKFRIIICTLCSSTIEKRSVLRHMSTVHKVTGLSTKMIDAILSEYSTSEEIYNEQFEMGLADPVQGIELLDGFKCSICDFLTTNEKLLKNHCSVTHSIQIKVNESNQCKIQTLFKGPKLKYFRVRTSQRRTQTSITFEILKDLHEEIESYGTQSQTPELTPRFVQTFETLHSWSTLVESIGDAAITEMFSIDDNTLKLLKFGLKEYYERFVKISRTPPTSVRRKMMEKRGNESGKIFKSLETESAINNYINYWIKLIIFMMNQSECVFFVAMQNLGEFLVG